MVTGWRSLKFWLLRGRYITSYTFLTLYYSLNPSCCTLHSSCSTNVTVFFGQTCQIKPFGILCRTLRLRVTLQEWVVCQCKNAERLYFRPRLYERQRSGRRASFVTGHSSSANLLHVLLPTYRAWCVAKCVSLSSQIVDTLLGLTKVMMFLKNYSGVFLRAIFFDVNSDPREHFWVGLGQKCDF